MGLWSGIGMPILLRLYWWRFNASGFVASMVGGLLSSLVVLLGETVWHFPLDRGSAVFATDSDQLFLCRRGHVFGRTYRFGRAGEFLSSHTAFRSLEAARKRIEPGCVEADET